MGSSSSTKKNLPPPPSLPTTSNQHFASKTSTSNNQQKQHVSSTTTSTAPATSSSSTKQTNNNNTSSSSSLSVPPPTPSSSAGAPATHPIGRVIKDAFREWLCSHSQLTNWQSRFAGYNRSEEEIRAAIVKELVYEACLTTRPDAQVEAVMFCKQGLAFGHFDFYPGFQKILKKALAEGVLTDVPKFFDRLMIAMHYAAVQQVHNHHSHGHQQQQQQQSSSPSSTSPNSTSLGSSAEPKIKTNRTGLFRQLSQLMFAVAESNPLDDDSPEANEEVADTMLRLWQSAPRDEMADDSVVDFILRPRACANKFPEMVVEMLTFGVFEAKVFSAEPVKKWIASDESKDSPLKKLLAENFNK